MSQKRVRTRFAPSPTGMLHIGGMRSAIYSWLLARHCGGDFLLRIEDTDQSRKVPGAVKYILEGFQWFGIDLDEGPSTEDLHLIEPGEQGLTGIGGPHAPYAQSRRLVRYNEIAEQLVEQGAAFRCDCTPEMIERERNEQIARKEVAGYSGYCRTRNVPADTKHVVRFKMPHKASVVIEDGIRGRIEWNSIPLRDPILRKADGFPTYHLAAMVDDHDMEITHILRGEEWIPSTPLHVLLYDALGWERPMFCHVPVVNGPDGKKLSKRHGSTSWSNFKEQGYLPEALLNFVILIGWSPGQGQEKEVFSKEELIKLFTLEGVHSASGVFDYNKLSWMNGLYIRALSLEEFLKRVRPFLQEAKLEVPEERLLPVLAAVQERCKLLTDAGEMLRFLEDKPLERDLGAMLNKNVDKELAKKILLRVADTLETLAEFSHEALDQSLHAIADELQLKTGPVFMCTRIAATGAKNTPPIADSLLALGKTESLRRIRETLELLRNL